MRGIAHISAVTIAAEYVGPGLSLCRCPRADGLLRGCAERKLQWQADSTRQHYEDGQRAPETDRRRSSVELSASSGHLGRLAKRQQSASQEATEIAWKAQHRLHKRYAKLTAAGKDKRKMRSGRPRTAGLHLGHRNQSGSDCYAAKSSFKKTRTSLKKKKRRKRTHW